MKNFVIFVVIVFLSASSAYANKDSVGVKNVNGRLFIMHKVVSGEGLYALSRRYNVDVDQISKENPGTDKGLLLGQIVLVPVSNNKPEVSPSGSPAKPVIPVSKPQKPVQTAKKQEAVYHTVASGETLYRIATSNNLSVQELKTLNNLSDNTIEVGQRLLIMKGEEPAAKANAEAPVVQKPLIQPKSAPQTSNDVAANTPEPIIPVKGKEHIDDKYQSQYDNYQKQLDDKRKMGRITLKEVEESVVASSIDDGSIISNKSLALHRSAPPGTIIQVKNPMNGKIVYVKVIATLPTEAADNNVTLKITRSAADQLGILDKYFRVDTHYSMEVIK